MFDSNPTPKEQLEQLSETALRVILAVCVMLENGQQAEADAFMKALEAVK